ncbi:MAG: hypothetical protein QM715_11605 [Nibricoccus sp.]
MIPARENPFSTDRVLRERYRLDESSWAPLIEKLNYHCGRGALVGPKGSGKTTLLEDLMVRLARPGRRMTLIRLSAESPRLSAVFDAAFFDKLDANDAVLVDGAEQLSLFQWLRFRRATRRAGMLIITTHRANRLPVLHRCVTSPQLLQELVSSLGVDLSSHEAHRLHRHHRGNIREALRELYDRCAEKSAPELSIGDSLV